MEFEFVYSSVEVDPDQLWGCETKEDGCETNFDD